MKKITTGILLLGSALLLLTGCPGRPGQKAQEEAKEETVFAVNTTKAVTGQLFDYLEINGDIVAQSSVDVYADTTGKLSHMNVTVGDYVRKNQVIAEVDPSRPGQTFAASPVKSPISGTVTSIPGDIGAVISSAVPVATVSKVDSLEISTGVAERYVSKISLGQRALVELAAYAETRFPAYISEVSPVVDPLTRTLSVTLAFDKQDSRIRAGMFAKVKIIIQEKKSTLKIPQECMVVREEKSMVFVLTDDSRVTAREIVPGIQIDNKLEVLSGLSAGDTVVIRGQTLLEDQAKIRVIDEVEPLSETDTIR